MADHAEVWALVRSHPEVLAAHAALDALELEEERLTRALGKAIRKAQAASEEHLNACDPWQERCGWCGRAPAPPSD